MKKNTIIGLSLGISIALVFSLSTNNNIIGICLGLSIGIGLALSLDSK